MRTPLSLDKHTALVLAGALAIATCSQPSWANSSIDRVDSPHQDLIQMLKGYEPPDNGAPDDTGDTGSR